VSQVDRIVEQPFRSLDPLLDTWHGTPEIHAVLLD